jgi:hypothetical protein
MGVVTRRSPAWAAEPSGNTTAISPLTANEECDAFGQLRERLQIRYDGNRVVLL